MRGSDSMLASLIDRLSSLSSSKSRCSSMIQAISQGRHLLTFASDSHHDNKKEHEKQSKKSNDKSDTNLLSDTHTNDANLIIIATHIINRLILHLRSFTNTTKHDDNCDDHENTHENKEEEEEGCAIILAALSFKVSQILLLDKAALERVISPSFGSSSKSISISIHRTVNANANNINDVAQGTDARSILSRSLLSVVMGCITSCHSLTTHYKPSTTTTTKHTKNTRLALIRKALWSSLFGLETVVNFTSPPTPHTNPTTADISTTMTSTHTNTDATANTNAPTNLSSSSHTSKSSSTSIKFNATTHAHVHSVPMNHALSQTWKDIVRRMSLASNMDVSLSDGTPTEMDAGTTTTDYSLAKINTLDRGQGSQDGAKDNIKTNRRGKKRKNTLTKDVPDESLSMRPLTTSTTKTAATGPLEKDIQNELASMCTFTCKSLFSSATEEEEQTLLLEIVNSCASSNIKTSSSPLINESKDKAKEQSYASNTTTSTNTTTTLSPPTKRPKRSPKRSTKSNAPTTTTTSKSISKDDRGETSNQISHKSLQRASNILLNTPEYTFNTIAIDGGFVSVKKWASMVLVWLCKGQDILLDVSLSLLHCDENGTDCDGGSAHSSEYGMTFWSRIMEPPILSETITSSPSSSGHMNIPASLSTATTKTTTEPSTSSSSEKRKKRGRGSKRSFRTMAEDGITDSHDSTGNVKNDVSSDTRENVNPTVTTNVTSAATGTAPASTLASSTSIFTNVSPSSTSSSSIHQHPFIPGNVTLVTYVTRLINLMVETCGTTVPKGGMDVYAGLVLKPLGFEYATGRHHRAVDPVKEDGKGEVGDDNNSTNFGLYGTFHDTANDDHNNTAETVAAPLSWQSQQRTTRSESGRKSRSDKTRGSGVGSNRSSSSSNSNSRVSLPLSLGARHAATTNTSSSLPGSEYKWKRPDIRSKAAVLMRLLLIAHEHCLRENIALPVLSAPEKGGVGSKVETKGVKREGLKGLDLVESMHLSKSSPLLYPLEDDDGTIVHVLLNEDYDCNCAQQKAELERMKSFTPKFFPTMHKTIESLARIASSSVLEPANVDAFDSMSLLLDIGSALAFKYSLIVQKRKNIRYEDICNTSVDTVVVVDTKLCSMGAHHLSDRVGNIVSSSKCSFLDIEERPNVNTRNDVDSERDGLISDELIEKFCLNKPLLPVIPKEDDEDSSSSGFCNYGGIFNFSPSRLGSDVDMVDASHNANDKSRQQRHLKEQNRISNGEVLSLFLRAMLPQNGKELSTEKKNDTASLLVKNLIRIIGCCYSVSDNMDMVETDSIRTTYTRCILSADCLDLLGKCLCYFPWGSKSSSDPAVLLSTRLRCALRKASLRPSYFCYFIELGKILERNLVGHRLRFAENHQESINVETKASVLIGSSFGNWFEFDHWERRLWSSHVKFCLSLGRGSPTFNSRSVCHLTSLETSFLGSVADRLSIFEAVTNITMSRPNLENSDHRMMRWPLYLSSIHHALVTSNLISDPLPQNSEDAAPERFICDALISSIDDALQNPMSIVNREALSMENKKNACRFQYSDDEIPLSLRDARLFAILVFRLKGEDRMKILSNLVNVLYSNLSNTKENKELTEMFIKCKEASGFLARVITVCLTMADVVCAGNELFDLLCQQIGPTHYHLPSFIEPSIYGDSPEENECDWYKKETCFMGLFSDWESPITPAVGSIESDEPLSVTDLSKLKTVLEISLNLGFESAKVDRCHLLFSAWNASGKVSCWDKSPRAGTFTIKKFSECGDALKMIKLRDEMCHTYTKVGKDVNSIPESFLSKILKKKSSFRGTETTHSGVGLLKQGLTESIAYLKDFDGNSSSEIVSETISSIFVSYEATVSYISFLISMFTKSDNEFLSTFVKPDKARNGRKRKGSSLSADSLEDGLEDEISDESGESESGYPDFDDDDEEAKLDGISRLHDVCSVIGAAPFHPDWLDINCRYRSGISEDMALDSAEKAFASLINFGNKIFSQYKNCIQRAFFSFWKLEPQQLGFDYSLPFLIMSTLQQSEESNGREEENETGWKKAVANIFNVDESVIHLITGKLHCRNKCSVKEAFCPNSAQRIRGKLQEFSSSIDGWEASTSEHRAGSEWELLLSDAFLGTCTDIKFPLTWKSSTNLVSSDSKCILDDTSDVQNVFTEAYRWCRVLHATVSAMVTCTALIRFSLNHGKGRKPHPLSKRDSNIQNRQLLRQISSSACHLDEEVCSPLNNPHHHVKKTLSKALAFLSEIASCGVIGKDLRQCAQAAACHLLRNSNDFNNLVAMNAIKNSLLCIKGLSEISSTDRNDAVLEGKNTVIEKMVILVEKLSHLDSSKPPPSNTGSFKLKCTRLLSCLGFRCILPLSTIAEESLDSRLLLAMNVFDNGVKSTESALAWDWSETQTETLNLLISMSQGVIQVTLKTRSILVLLMKNLLESEEYYSSNDTDITRESAFIKSSVLKNWNDINEDHLQLLTRNDICINDVSFDSNSLVKDRTLHIELSRNQCFILAYLVGSISFSPPLKSPECQACKVILRNIKECIEDVLEKPELIHVIDLACLLAIRFDELIDIGMQLLYPRTNAKLSENIIQNSHRLAILEHFCRFLRDIRAELDGHRRNKMNSGTSLTETKSSNPPTNNNSSNRSTSDAFQTKSSDSKLRACTFVETGGEYSEQHWYNCYTCGLVWEKGCCSLCAQICHKGHDVGYSRSSSFFCDCGAEVACAGEQNRVACKCLTPLSDTHLLSVYENNQDPCDRVSSGTKEFDGAKVISQDHQENKDSIFNNKVVEISVRCFPSCTSLALDHFVEAAAKSVFTKELFENFNASFDNYRSEKKNRKSLYGLNNGDQEVEKSKLEKDQSRLQDLSLNFRSGKPLEINYLKDVAFIPIRASKGNSLKPKLSFDATTERLKRAVLSKNDIKRNILVSDHRGRLIIAESCSILFCAGLPITNIRHVEKPLENPLERSQLCILGSAKVKFCIVGMKLCSDDNRQLLVWGTSEASVFFLSKDCDKVEKRIDLVVELEPHECETEYLLKAEWMPSSSGMIIVIFCATFVKIFDIRRSTANSGGRDQEYSCRASTCYTLAYEDVIIRGAALIRPKVNTSYEDINSESRQNDAKEAICSKMVLLFDSGRLHMTDISLDSNGDLEDQGESYIECGDGISFPTSGVRRYNGGSAGAPGSSSTSFGEGSSLIYLSQSGLLLYKCISSSLIAFNLDENGNIIGSFEFLPHVINTETLAMGMEGHSISDPYTQWKELGTVEREGSFFYRVAFVGKSLRNNQPKLLYLEFNSNEINVNELNWPAGNDMNLGLSPNTSLEGVAAFSGPLFHEKRTETGFIGNHRQVIERVFLGVVTSNGSLLMFGETISETAGLNDELSFHSEHAFTSSKRGRDLSDSATSITNEQSKRSERSNPAKTSDSHVNNPIFPLTIFERLINVSNKTELRFGGDGTGNEPELVKKKLSISSVDFVTSPSKDGCTFTVTLRSNKQNDLNRNESSKKDCKLICKTTNTDKANENFAAPAKFAIVAIRILVGSTRTEYLPREFVVMGRPIKPKQGMKRWYDIPLTDEEILLGVRSGFVTIGIGTSFDLSSNQGALIDAVEVYAQEREKMPHIFSFRVDDAGTAAECSNDQPKKSSTNILPEEEISKESLNSSMLAVTHICQLLGKNIDQSSHLNHQTLQRLIQVTALDSHGQGEVRSHVIELLKEVESDAVTRQMLLDEGTLFGVAEVLRDELEKRFGMPPHTGASDSNNNAFEKHLFVEKQPGPLAVSTSQNEEALCNLNRCIKSSLSIVKSRPENYKQIMENLRSSGLITFSVANDAKVVLDCFEFTAQNFSDTAANMIELAILEMVTEETSLQKDPKFVGMGPILSDMLNSRNSVLVQHCCFTIAKVLGDTAIKSNMRMDTENNGVNIPPPIAYQCDGCEIFPITGTRYTLEEGHDIDLCKTCYESGCNFAKSKNYESGIALQVNGKRLHLDDKEMTCDQVHQMRPMPIASMIVEQVRRAAESAQNSSVIEDADDDTAALQHALKMSLETQGESRFPATDFAESIPPILYVVRSRLFDGLLKVVCQSLSFGANDSGVYHLPSIIDLLLTLVFKSEPGKDQVDLGKKLCETICKQMVMLIDLCIKNALSKESLKKVRSSLFLCLRALVSLLKKKDLSFTDIVENSEAEESNEPDTESSMLLGEKNKDKTDPRFVCDVHRVPAVRRRCSHGEHKDRRFYVCGMERKQRCKYFKWADAEDAPKTDNTPLMSSLDQTKTNQQFDSSFVSSSKGNTKESQKVSVDSEIQSQLWSLISEGVPSLQMQLCKLLQVYFKKVNANSFIKCGIACTSNEEKANEKSSIVFPVYDETCALEDMHDGISNSIEKLGFSCHPCIKGLGTSYLNAKDTAVQGTNESSVVQASLDLLSLIAMNSLGPSTKSSPSTWECWFAPLCEIISTSSSSHLRAQAKKMLKRLCGGRRAIYHKVRDHYVFGFHFTQLLQHCEGLLRAALAVREKARRCGSDWRGAKITWRTLPSGGLIGVEDLISEDSQTVETCEKVTKVLDELIDITKTRGQNWRHFCALNGLPKSSNIIKAGSTADTSSKVSIKRKHSVLGLNARGGIRDRSPICLLLWIACSVSGSNQVKVFQLMDVALSSSSEQSAGTKASGADENIGILSTDGGTDFEGSIQNHPQGIINSDADCPGMSLLSGLTGMAMDDIFAFIVQFVLKGTTPALRIVTSSIARSLVLASPSDEMDNLFQRLNLLMLRHIGELGSEAADFLKLMHAFVSEKQILKAITLAPISNVVMSCFTNQISTCHNAKSSLLGEEAKVVEIEIGQGKKKTIDLTSCARCQLRGFMSCEDSKKITEKDRPTSSQGSLNIIGKSNVGSNRTLRSGSTVTSLSGKKNDFTDIPWAVEQVRGFSRNRIEVSTLNIISTEFASHFQLKNRLAISEFHLSVNDPRGRFVKSIGIFFTPRPVSVANELSRGEYKDLWQRCGTLSLTRGAGRASCKLTNPIVAANLKFEYLEFFEKIGGARSSDGSLLLHCPRCTRVVNNAHGVCGHCGEVAFQCRKCRHINYDRLDAFLCVECGYCASGGFSYEISAGMASKAVAIVNDDGLERAVKLLRISSRKLSDTTIALKKKVLEAAVCTQRKRHRGDNFDDLDGISSYSPPLKRALLGEFPKVTGKGMGDYLGGGDAPGKRRSASSGAHSTNRQHDSSSLSSPTNKARSLLSLARQLRSESSGLGDDHTSRGDLLVRQALMNSTSGLGGGNSGGSFEFFDETEGDMLNIINASGEGNVLQLDMPEPLSRLVANIQARVRNSASGASAGRNEAGTDGRRGGSAGNNDDGGNIDTESQKNDQSPQSHLDDCEKLQQQLREAERDCSDLQRKIISWKRLNRDALTDFGEPIVTAQLSYAPITCSSCSQVVTFHLLALAMALFQANIEDSEKGLSKEFIWCLFEEPKGMTPDFFDVKRLAIITIATKSKIGAKLIFDELRSRLDSTRDVASAEILGKLLEKEFSMVNEYTQLAVDILRNN